MDQPVIDILLLFSLGSLGGLLAGLLGIGGGVIYVLIFAHYLPLAGVPDTLIVPSIVANSMFAILFAGLSGTYKQWRNNNFFPKPVIAIGLAASVFSIFFTLIINSGTWYTKERFTFLFIALLILITWRLLSSSKDELNTPGENLGTLKSVSIGALSGTIAAFSGIGGGVIIVPLLTHMGRIYIKKATSISLGVISVMALLTSVYNFFFQHHAEVHLQSSLGLIVFSISLPVAIGSLLFSPVGVILARKVEPKIIKIVFVAFLCSVILKMLIDLL